MKKVLIWGASPSIQTIFQEVNKEYQIIGFIDNNSEKWNTILFGTKVYSPPQLVTLEYDYVIIASLSSMTSIKNQILSLGIDEKCILTKYVEYRVRARIDFLRKLSVELREALVLGDVAEVGVFQGDFASHINECFPDKRLYLFDSFNGFDQRDIEVEQMYQFSNASEGHLKNTSIGLVMQKMKHPENIVIKEGYFPETTIGLENTFCFISMDLDLYRPTIEGLKVLWTKLSVGGVILIHDYYSGAYLGIKQAVREFQSMIKDVVLFPVGDDCSIGLMKIDKFETSI
ncbi:methyltransferase [Paenibacillus sp. DXFW5]|uniref:Methyltransferase n=1 Tax=Paenibacillus rhizolycopersici TaxID=2780073 RepID=A0ABS2HA57_9BACL|nr:TylF/MycF/NovP-related O-methyltransferase [Paenibacillus rhizolycopersici]MBM6997258.1 methyltransferase [Paenibacillus rhizolycopersici]